MRHMIRWFSLLALVLLVGCGGTQAALPATAVPTVPVAAAPTVAPTEMVAPTEVVAPTVAATEVPTEAATEAPTVAPTEAPTIAPTEAAMETATASETTAASTETATANVSGDLTVFAAASLTEAFGEVGTNFEAAHPGTTVTFNFAGSQQLAQQITQGAPVDVFASASGKTMTDVITTGLVISGTQRTFVRNRLVIIYPKDNPAGITQLSDLAKPGIKLDLAAKEVPVGQYALDFLDKASNDPAYGASFKESVLANVVSYEENVKAVFSKVSLGEADAGIVYTTDISLDAADDVGRLDIPDTLNTIASYPIAALKDSANADLAAAFISYVLAPEGQQVLVKYGFIPTNGSATGAAPQVAPLVIEGLVTTPMTLAVADFAKMEQATIKATDRDGAEQSYTGVRIATILAAAGVQPNATSVVLTGGDGYTQTISLADIQADADAIIAVDASGSFRNILPSQMPKFWIKGLVSMVIK